MMNDTITTTAPADEAATRLAALKAERARILEAREQREAETATARELEEVTQQLADEKAIDAAIEAHGPLDKKIATVQTTAGLVIVKKPNHVLFKRFQDSGESSTDEFTKLVRPCVVYPDKPRFDAMLDDSPGILGPCAKAVCLLAGVKLKEVSAK
jgi:hypothetical protein